VTPDGELLSEGHTTDSVYVNPSGVRTVSHWVLLGAPVTYRDMFRPRTLSSSTHPAGGGPRPPSQSHTPPHLPVSPGVLMGAALICCRDYKPYEYAITDFHLDFALDDITTVVTNMNLTTTTGAPQPLVRPAPHPPPRVCVYSTPPPGSPPPPSRLSGLATVAVC
jgi:hypothetical protein